jgi:antirestriction protein ArdC
MADFDSEEEYYVTLFHEFIHSTGLEKRLNRKGIKDKMVFGDEDYSNEELTAET